MKKLLLAMLMVGGVVQAENGGVWRFPSETFNRLEATMKRKNTQKIRSVIRRAAQSGTHAEYEVHSLVKQEFKKTR